MIEHEVENVSLDLAEVELDLSSFHIKLGYTILGGQAREAESHDDLG